MTFNELIELDKEAEKKQAKRKAPEKPRAPQVPGAPEVPLELVKSIPSPAPVRLKPKTKPIATKHDTERDTTIPRYRGTTAPTMVKGIRKAVKQLGKEAATHRFTREEKDAIARIVFTYGRQGIKTSGNEIIRIGFNWLLEDHQVNGKQSILHKVLVALNA